MDESSEPIVGFAAQVPSPFEPYELGQFLHLKITESHYPEMLHLPSTISAKIVKFIYPRTKSCCMLMEIQLDSLQDRRLVLKLYDRRFADAFRHSMGASEWSQSLENEHVQAVQRGEDNELYRSIITNPNYVLSTEMYWPAARREMYLALCMESNFYRETIVYGILKDIQGQRVPRHVADVELILAYENDDETLGPAFTVKGILLQYIEGIPLAECFSSTNHSHWKNIILQALNTIDAITEHKVVSGDDDISNYIIVPPRGERQHRVVRVDLASGRYLTPHGGAIEAESILLEAKLERDALVSLMKATMKETVSDAE